MLNVLDLEVKESPSKLVNRYIKQRQNLERRRKRYQKQALEERSKQMPKILRVRAAQDEQEERQVRKLAASRHGPADWIIHARMVARSWDGERVEAIAKELQCSPQTVRRRLHRFDAEGIEGLGDQPKSGRRRRLTVADDSKLIALVRQAPPGRLVTREDGTMVARDEQGSAQWSLNALAQAAKEAGISVKRSQIRRIKPRQRMLEKFGQ